MRVINSTLLAILVLLANGLVFAQSKEYKQMPFILVNEQIVVEGLLKGQKIKLTLSTKSPSSINETKFSKYIRKSLLKSQEKDELYITYTPVSVVSGIKIGEVKVNKLKMFSYHTVSSSQLRGVERDGVLGHDFFKNKVVQIDYKDKVLRIYKENPYRDLIKSNLKGNDAFSIVKLKVNKPYLPYKNSYVVAENVKLKKLDVKILIDINQNAEFTLSESFKPSLNNSNILEYFKLGSFTLKNFEAEFVQSFNYQETHNAALGSKFFQNYLLTLDFRKKLMILEKIEIN